jgi:hypothetical protein
MRRYGIGELERVGGESEGPSSRRVLRCAAGKTFTVVVHGWLVHPEFHIIDPRGLGSS